MTAWDTKKLPLFNGLNPLQIHNLIGNARIAEFKKDTLICHHNEKSKNVFIVLRGSLKVFSKSGDLLGVLQENDIFNEIGFVYELPCCTSFVTTEDSRLLILDKNLIETLSKTDSALKKVIMRNILSSLKRKSASFEQSTQEKTQDSPRAASVSCL